MLAADEELLRLLRAVKAHEPTAEDNHHHNVDDAAVTETALDYADAFDEDAVLLCLNALQAAVDADEWRASEPLTTLVDELLDWRIGALDLDRKPKTELLVVRWQFITRAIESGVVVGTAHDIALRLLACMNSDRFAALDAQYALVQCLTLAIDRRVVVASHEQALELLKQFYATLARVSVRQQLGTAMVALMANKDDVKLIVNRGLLRAVVQVALSEERALQAKKAIGEAYDDDDEEDDAAEKLARLIAAAVHTLRHVAMHACPKSEVSTTHDTPTKLCDVVVELLLSRMPVVFDEGVRLLQMLVECPSFLNELPSRPDLRGALEKAKTLASKPEGKPTVHDPYVASLCVQLYALLTPQIDAYEKQHGSLVGMSSTLGHESSRSPEAALAVARECKSRGNAFYQRGNFATARLFYRRGVSIVRAAEAQADQQLAALPLDELRRRCSVGASVQVVQRNGALRSAMVSDVDDDDDVVDVLYDDDGERDDGDDEERVPLSRVRLRMDTILLEQLKTVAVDCAMNMGKAFTMLVDHERAIECFTHVLTLQPQYIAVLYHRGVASLAVHDLERAQKDLWDANQLCSKWNTRNDVVEIKKKKALHAQIVAAYKRLQTLHANKKKVDKRLVKQMMGYISSLPGLQGNGD